MAQSRGPQTFAPPNPYYYQQQNPDGQMGTRGVGGPQGQPGGVQGPPPGIQGQVEPQPGFDMSEQVPVNLSPQEKLVLQEALGILKEGRAALASGGLEGEMAQRLTAAHAYVSGFLEARGLGELGGYVSTIPPVTTRGASVEPEYDQLVDDFEGFLSDETQTRFFAPIIPPPFIVNRALRRIWRRF